MTAEERPVHSDGRKRGTAMGEPCGTQGEAVSASTILIVEDDPDIGALLCEIINAEMGSAPLLVPDAAQALQALQSVVPLLLLLDYHLPGMNGIQFYDLLHQDARWRKVPVLLLSADLPWKDMQQRGLPGISKPFKVLALLKQIKTLLASPVVVQSPR